MAAGRFCALFCFLFTVVSSARAQLVQYEVTFDATWSEGTHPVDFPSSAHFSGLIGGTHNSDVSFWDAGELASLGIKRMAEFGSKSPLNSEVQAAISDGNAADVISGGGIGVSPGGVSESFLVGSSHSSVTLVSMIAPSPDWFVGVSGLDLRQDGRWQPEVVVDLFPYDAGTDSGPTYRSPNQATAPPEPISHIDSLPIGNGTPLGTFTFRLTTLLGDADQDGDVDTADRTIVSTNWTGALMAGEADRTFSEGDFDGDGDVDSSDTNTLVLNWTGARMAGNLLGNSFAAPRELDMVVVPELTSATMLALGWLGLAAVRHRRSKFGRSSRFTHCRRRGFGKEAG